MILTKRDILEYEDGYKQIQIIAGLIIPLIGLVFFMDVSRLNLPNHRLNILRAGFISIFIVFCINILTIYHISVHISKVYDLMAGVNKKNNNKSNIEEAYRYHLNNIPAMNFTIRLFKISLIILIIAIVLVIVGKHKMVNSFLINILILISLITCVQIAFLSFF